jgi:hypothetical protein
MDYGKIMAFLSYRRSPENGHQFFAFFGDPNSSEITDRVQVKVTWPLDVR